MNFGFKRGRLFVFRQSHGPLFIAGVGPAFSLLEFGFQMQYNKSNILPSNGRGNRKG